MERLGVGQKIERAFLDTLELVFISGFTPRDKKEPVLARAILRLDALKFFLQLAWENRLVTTEQYSSIIASVEEVGRMLWGWKKGLESKTPAYKAGEQ